MGVPLQASPLLWKVGFCYCCAAGPGSLDGLVVLYCSWLSVPGHRCAQNLARRAWLLKWLLEKTNLLDPWHGRNQQSICSKEDTGVQSSDNMSWEAVVLSSHTRGLLGNTGWKEAAGEPSATSLMVGFSRYTGSYLVWTPQNSNQKSKAEWEGDFTSTQILKNLDKVWPSFALS